MSKNVGNFLSRFFFALFLQKCKESVVNSQLRKMKKILLMGKSGSGKTSMRSVIFANYKPTFTKKIAPTLGVERTHLKSFGNVVLSLWDCGGQEEFSEEYFFENSDVFKGVNIFVYVFDAQSKDSKAEIMYFMKSFKSVLHFSKQADIFCLINKMDLVGTEERVLEFKGRCEGIQKVLQKVKCQCFMTSIYDDTLYHAWSSIVHMLIPHMQEIRKGLEKFIEVVDADKVVLLQKSTSLVISYYERRPFGEKLEKVSKLLQQFRLRRSVTPGFQGMEVKNSNFACFIEKFTPSTYIMVVFSNPEITSTLVKINIKEAQRSFLSWEKIPESQ